MDSKWLDDLRRWFDAYFEGYIGDGDLTKSMLELKRKHSVMVAGNCRAIASELGWPTGDVIIAEGLGLLHDIARFSQFAEYRTFQDAISINHGERGYEIASALDLVTDLLPDRRQCILDGIRHHNARIVPATVGKTSLPFVKLIRDADKIDIYRIMSETLADRRLQAHLTNALQVKGPDTVSPEALADIRAGITVDNSHIVSAGDFLLMQLSWIYDINYPQTYRRLSESGVFNRIGQALPDTPEVQEIVRTVLTRLSTIS